MNTLKKPILVYAGAHDTGTTGRFDAIRDAMHDALGKDYAHGHSAGDVFSVAIASERWCGARGLRVKDRVGLLVVDTSSKERMPTCYGWRRKVTVVTLLRRTRGWYLVSVGTAELSPSEKGGRNFHLTPAQDARVKKWLAAQYAVQAPKAEKGGE